MKPLLSGVVGSLRRFAWPDGVQCLLCAELTRAGCLCSECQADLDASRSTGADGIMHAGYHYKSAAGKLVHLLKFSAVEAAAKPLADGMAEEARKFTLPADTVVTWVAMPEIRRRSRGVDHARTLATELASRLGLPADALLCRTGMQKEQRSLSAQDRQVNIRKAFTCPKPVMHPVLLVDDVRTTGATITACTEVLLRAGAPTVFVVTATRASADETAKNNDNTSN